MAFYKTHSITYPSGISVELYQDLGSSPSSVEKLPLILNGTGNIKFRCSTDYGFGVVSFSWKCAFLNKNNLIDKFNRDNYGKLYIQVKDGSTILFTGLMQLDTKNSPLLRYNDLFQVNFVDPYYQNKRKDFRRYTQTPAGEMTVFVFLQACINANTPGNTVICHPWEIENWASSTGAPTQIMQLEINNNFYNNTDKKYSDFLSDILQTMCATFGYSHIAQQSMFIHFGEGWDADSTVAEVSGWEIEGSNRYSRSYNVPSYSKFSKNGRHIDPNGFGYIGAHIQNNAPTSTIEVSSANLAEILPSFDFEIPYDVYSFASSQDDGMSFDDGTSEVVAAAWDSWKWGSPSTIDFIDAVINYNIDKFFGIDYEKFRIKAVNGLVDPIMPFTIKGITGRDLNMRALRGEWNLQTKKTDVECFKLGGFS